MSQTEKKADDPRAQSRHHLVYYLQVFDPQGEEMVGHLADLSSEGMMMLCPRPLAVGQHYRLRLAFPKPIANRSELLLEGNCRWCRPDINTELHAVGIQLEGLDPRETKFLLCLIDDFGFND
ncbi:MAG: hypothetical protein BWK76_06375 [Desulfobulbaceae bacterium A2]|nr:MAG: hypothetical protein BWK76_06375 [Desulfobulbaceae bacterium A2]